MREVVEARRKRPRRRPAAPVEQGEDPVDRPVEAGVFARLDDMLARHRAERPPTATTPGSALTSTPAPANLVDRDFTAERPNEKWLTDISEIKARDGKVYLSPMIDCHDGKIVAYTAGFSPNAELANRMLVKAAETLPEGVKPLVHSDRGCHYRWPGWLDLMERYGLTRSMSAKGCSPDNAAAEGFFGRMKTESVYPEHWEKRTRDEVLILIDDYIRWYNHERIKRSLGWMSPVQYRQSQGMAA